MSTGYRRIPLLVPLLPAAATYGGTADAAYGVNHVALHFKRVRVPSLHLTNLFLTYAYLSLVHHVRDLPVHVGSSIDSCNQ
jgi:hypothetical protein